MMPSRFTKIQIKPTRGSGSGPVTVLTGDGGMRPLTDTPTHLFDVALPVATRAGGVIIATIDATDGTDDQSLTTIVAYAAVNQAGTITTAFSDVAVQDAKVATGASTLTVAWGATTAPGKFTVNITPTGSLTETIYEINFFVLATIGQVTVLR